VIGGLVSIVRPWPGCAFVGDQTEATLGCAVRFRSLTPKNRGNPMSAYTFSALAGFRITEWVRTKPPAYRVCAI